MYRLLHQHIDQYVRFPSVTGAWLITFIKLIDLLYFINVMFARKIIIYLYNTFISNVNIIIQ